MKLTLTTLISFFLLSLSSIKANEDFSYKYEKITDYELSMNSYDPDTTASALIIYDKSEMEYFFDQAKRDLTLRTTRTRKIKILKKEGLLYADNFIKYKKRDVRIASLNACTYNLNNGKVIKTKLSKDYVFDELIEDDLYNKKFTLKDVKIGSVIEIKYITHSNFLVPNTWYFQCSDPIKYSCMNLVYPDPFKFSFELRGFNKIKNIKEAGKPITFYLDGDWFESKTTEIKLEANDIPALKEDIPFLWQSSDYRTQVITILEGIQHPSGRFKAFNQTWESVDELLLTYSTFGTLMKMSNPFEKEMSKIDYSSLDRKKQVLETWKLLRKYVTWDKTYKLYSEKGTKKIIAERTGSNADLNFILMSMLRTLDIPSVPVLMSLRSHGILPITTPSIDDLSTFVICFFDGEKLSYIDTSTDNFLINTLDPNLLSRDARILRLGKYHPTKPMEALYGSEIYSRLKSLWVDLSTLGSHNTQAQINCSISNNKLNGTCTYIYKGIDMLDNIVKYNKLGENIEYIESIEKDKNISLNNLDRLISSESLKEKFDFEKKIESSTDSIIYINPLVFPYLTENLFKETERKLPFEFNHTNIYSITSSIEIPYGYEVESLPQSIKIGVAEDKCKCSVLFGIKGNMIQTNFVFRINNIFFAPEYYEDFKEFFSMIADKSNSMIVLKKKDL